jgi:hypothetical protein
MTTLSGVGQSAASYLQQLAGQKTAAGAAAGTASVQGAKAAHHGLHHHGAGAGSGGTAGSQAQVTSLLDTISKALQSADSSADPNQVIEDTVAKLLQNGGTTDSDDITANTVQQASNQISNQPGLVELLKAHGVSPQQFQADLRAAIKDAQQGQVNPATALQSFPPGSALNLTA